MASIGAPPDLRPGVPNAAAPAIGEPDSAPPKPAPGVCTPAERRMTFLCVPRKRDVERMLPRRHRARLSDLRANQGDGGTAEKVLE